MFMTKKWDKLCLLDNPGSDLSKGKGETNSSIWACEDLFEIFCDKDDILGMVFSIENQSRKLYSWPFLAMTPKWDKMCYLDISVKIWKRRDKFICPNQKILRNLGFAILRQLLSIDIFRFIHFPQNGTSMDILAFHDYKMVIFFFLVNKRYLSCYQDPVMIWKSLFNWTFFIASTEKWDKLCFLDICIWIRDVKQVWLVRFCKSNKKKLFVDLNS